MDRRPPGPLRRWLDVGSGESVRRRPTCIHVQVFNRAARPRRGPCPFRGRTDVLPLFAALQQGKPLKRAAGLASDRNAPGRMKLYAVPFNHKILTILWTVCEFSLESAPGRIFFLQGLTHRAIMPVFGTSAREDVLLFRLCELPLKLRGLIP